MKKIKILKTGLLYKNPSPHVRSVHAYFPSVVRLENGEMLATVVLGEAFEAVNLHTHLCRSTDDGETWQMEGPLYEGTKDRLTSDCSRLTALPSGELVVFMVRHDRSDHPDEGLVNHENMGFVPTELLLFRSHDAGRTWTEPVAISPPLEGPAFELCCPITLLSDGRWIIPTQTWQGWNGDCPNGIKMMAFVSPDEGKTWPDYFDVMNSPKGKTFFFWESKIVELPNGRLLAVAWQYDSDKQKDAPNQYSISKDNGRTWSPPASTELSGQTLTPFVIDDERILSIYRRMDKPGLWANLSHFKGDTWVNDLDEPLWGFESNKMGAATTTNMAHNFNVLKFGAPSVTRLADGTLFVAFWCHEESVSVIRWFKLGNL